MSNLLIKLLLKYVKKHQNVEEYFNWRVLKRSLRTRKACTREGRLNLTMISTIFSLQIKLPENDVNVIFVLTKLNGFRNLLLQIILLQDLIWFRYDLLTCMRSQIRLSKKCYPLTGIENKDPTDIDCASVQYKWYHGRSLVNDPRPFGHIFARGSSRSSSMKIGAVANRAAAAG